MTNPEGDSAAAQNTKENAAVDTGVKSEFLERVSEIPVVNAAKEYSTTAYDKVKQMNRFTAAALSIAETTALYFAVTAKPFLEKVQPQAQLVDQLACRGLDAVEEKVPFLLKSPEQLVEDARKLCSSTVEMGYQKVDEMKIMGADTLNSVKNYGVQKANDALSGTEGFVDKYLPPAFGEGSPEAAADDVKTVTGRANKLTSKIGLRVYGHGVKQLLTLHKLSQESVSKLVYTMELLQQVKQNYGNKSFQEYVDEAKVKSTWIWEELNKEPTESTDAQKSLEQRMLSLARRTTSVMVHAYSLAAVPLSTLPQSYSDLNQGFQTASTYASELFAQLDQASNAGEVTSALLAGIREKISGLQAVIQRLTPQTEQIQMEELEVSKSSESAETEPKSVAS